MIFIWNEIVFIPLTKRLLVPFRTSMNLRQCLYKVYPKHDSYFLTSCSFSDHGLGFCFINQRASVNLASFVVLLHTSLCSHFLTCLSKYDCEEEKLQNFSCNKFLQLFFQRLTPVTLSHTSGLDMSI